MPRGAPMVSRAASRRTPSGPTSGRMSMPCRSSRSRVRVSSPVTRSRTQMGDCRAGKRVTNLWKRSPRSMGERSVVGRAQRTQVSSFRRSYAQPALTCNENNRSDDKRQRREGRRTVLTGCGLGVFGPDLKCALSASGRTAEGSLTRRKEESSSSSLRPERNLAEGRRKRERNIQES